MRRLTLLPTLLVLLGAALFASAGSGHGQSSRLDIGGATNPCPDVAAAC